MKTSYPASDRNRVLPRNRPGVERVRPHPWAIGFLVAGLMVVGSLATPASAQDPYRSPDDSRITLDGTVVDVGVDEFTLDYGDGIVTVEMDDEDRAAETYRLAYGDRVRVTGRIDDDFFESTSIEAHTVYVHGIGMAFYADATDEEIPHIVGPTEILVSTTVLDGMVSEVRADEFVINTGQRAVTVEVDEMASNPLDDQGSQRIETGDWVSVTGSIDRNFFEDRVIVAESVVELVD